MPITVSIVEDNDKLRETLVRVLDRAAHARFVDQLDQAQLLERPDVVGDGAEARTQPARQLIGGRLALVEHGEDPDAQRMAHGLHVARIIDVLDWFHFPPMSVGAGTGDDGASPSPSIRRFPAQ